LRYLIAHAPWAPGRKQALSRLLEQLPEGVEVIQSRGPEHAAIWSRRLWERAAEIGCACWSHACAYDHDHVVLLNDDVHVAADLDARLRRAVAAVPDECISLHCNNPNALPVTGAWARCYHYSGPGVVLPPGAAAGLLDFVYSLSWSLLSRMNEDNVAAAWAWSRQRPFWYLLPSPVTHDPGVPSTLGYDAHPHRVPVTDGPERDVTDTTAPFVEIDWCVTPGLRYRREVIRSGQHLCTFCVGRVGTVGSVEQGIMLCNACLAELTSAALRAK